MGFPVPSSSRSVLRMSAEKAARKRAFDRLNQQCSRAKTKARITELEGQVKELKGLLQSAEDENQQLWTLLTDIRSFGQGLQSSLDRIGQLGQQRPDGVPERQRTPEYPQLAELMHAESSQKLQLPQDGAPDEPTEDQAGAEQTDPLSILDAPPPLQFPDDAGAPLHVGLHAGFPMFGNLCSSNTTLLSIDLLASDLLAGDEPWAGGLSDHVWPNEDIASIGPFDDSPTDDRPVWSIALRHTPPQQRLDHLMIDMANSLRHPLPSSRSSPEFTPELQATSFPSIKSLLNPQHDNVHAMPAAAALGKHGYWMGLRLPERMAVLHNIARLVHWETQAQTQVQTQADSSETTKAAWDAMPPTLRPTDLQRRHAHPAWVAAMIWPDVRDALILRGDWSGPIFKQLRDKFNSTFCINWPHAVRDIFVSLDSSDTVDRDSSSNNKNSEVALHPAFQAHIRDVRNWTCETEWTGDLAFLNDLIPKTMPPKDSMSKLV